MMTVIHVNGKRCCFKIVRTLRLCRIRMLLSRHSLHSYTLSVCEYFGSHSQADNVPSTSVYVFPPSPPMCPPRMCVCFRPHLHPRCPFANVYVFPPSPSPSMSLRKCLCVSALTLKSSPQSYHVSVEFLYLSSAFTVNIYWVQ